MASDYRSNGNEKRTKTKYDMMNLPKSGDIVECIKNIKVDDFEYVSGQLYTVYDNANIHVIINTGSDSSRRDHHGGFVQDPDMFDGIPYHDHFKLKTSAKDIKLFTVTGWKKDDSWNGGSVKTWTETADKSRYSYFSLTDQHVSVDLYKLKTVKFFNYARDIRITGSVTKEWNGESEQDNPDEWIEFEYGDIVLSPKTKSLTISNANHRSTTKQLYPIYIDNIDIPKTTKDISMENVSMNFLDCTGAETIHLKHCNIGMLVVNPKTIKSIVLKNTKVYQSKNCTIFSEALNGCGTILSIIKLDGEDSYITSFTPDKVNKKEITAHCNTLQLKATIEHFGLDATAKFRFIKKDWDNGDKYVTKNSFSFSDYDGKLEAYTQNNELVIYKGHEPLRDAEFNLTLDKNDQIKVYMEKSYNYETMLLGNKIFNRLAKFSEHDQLPNTFFDVLFKHPSISYVKNTGLVDIKDFDFTMMDSYEKYKDCELIYYSGGAWRWKQKISTNTGSYGDRSEYGKIEWVNVGFELSTKGIKDGSYYVRPGIKKYWKRTKDIMDLYGRMHDELEWTKYDESKVYSVPHNMDMAMKKDEADGFVGGYVFNGYIYSEMTGREGQEWSSGAYRQLHASSYSVPLSDMQGVAKKYGFKLNPFMVDANYDRPAKYKGFTRSHGSDKSSDKYAIMNYYFSEYGNPIYKNKDRQRSDSPFINIGGKLYIYNGYNGGSRDDYDEVGEIVTSNWSDGTVHKYQSSEDLKDLLIANNYEYSFVNIDIPPKLKTDVLRFIENNPGMYYAYKRGANQKLSCLFYRFYHDRDQKLENQFDDKVKITEQMKTEWFDLVERIAKCFEATKKRIKREYNRDKAIRKNELVEI